MQTMLDFQNHEPQDGRSGVPARGFGGVVQVRAKEGGEVWAGLGDDEVIYVEELSNAVERGVAVSVGGMSPGAECGG